MSTNSHQKLLNTSQSVLDAIHRIEESAACGIGFIATETGEPSNFVTKKGLEILEKMEHRGGVAAIPDWERLKGQYIELKERVSDDLKHLVEDKITKIEFDQKVLQEYFDSEQHFTSDGRGVMVDIDQDFFRQKFPRRGQPSVSLDKERDFAVGMFYLPKDNIYFQDACLGIIKDVFDRYGYYKDARYRETPMHEEVLGEKARSATPYVRQYMIPQKEIPAGASEEEKARLKREFDLDLFFMRKEIENRVADTIEQEKKIAAEKGVEFKTDGSEDFYIPSMSRKTIVYKGLSVANDLGNLYSDLHSDEYKTRFVIPHDRYSTNTAPAWRRAHPYRHIAHNGEINSLPTNINMIGRIENLFAELYPNDRKVEDLFPIIQTGGTDSAMLDNVVEFLLHAGLSPAAVKMLLIPEAFEENANLSPEVKELYKYIDVITQPFDGPATVVIAGNDQIVLGGDRGGLRPNRFQRLKIKRPDGGIENLVMSISEDMDLEGMDIAGEVLEKRNLEPGEMVGVNLQTGEVLSSAQLKQNVAEELEQIFGIKNFLKRIAPLEPIQSDADTKRLKGADLSRAQAVANITQEHLEFIETVAETGKEPRGSMGDDAPLTVVSKTYRTADNFFQQDFAQITNPPIDTIRERSVMSLKTYIGSPDKGKSEIIELKSPILSNATFAALRKKIGEPNIVEIDCTFDIRGDENQMQFSLDRIKAEAIEAAKAGKKIVLTDRNVDENHAAVPMLFAAGAVNSALLNSKLRDKTSINVETAQVSYSHGFATMIGLGGADTVNAYLAEDTVASEHELKTQKYEGKTLAFSPNMTLGEMLKLYPLPGFAHSNDSNKDKLAQIKTLKKTSAFVKENENIALAQLIYNGNEKVKKGFESLLKYLDVPKDMITANQSLDSEIKNFIKGSQDSLLKTMGKKGVAHISSYRGGRMFEALGIGEDIIHQCFSNLDKDGRPFNAIKSPVKGLSMKMFQEREVKHHKEAYTYDIEGPVKDVGRYKIRVGEGVEEHVMTSEAIAIFQDALKTGDYDKYKHYRDLIQKRSQDHRFAIRDWMDFKSDRNPIDLSEVEPASEIVKRFFTGAMSFGSISKEAHENLAVAMNRLGAKSNSGEGGENPERYGTEKRSKVKQVASGRFGVTLDYLIDADVIQIKVAQGAKPGEGGELPGGKVGPDVAENRYVKEGTDLISPPPHHDIYSIEDLEELIFDLKQANPNAKIDVKLVSASGVDTVATGVAKAYADAIHIGGANGSTGASPQTSITHAGMPWETSVNKVDVALKNEYLRERVKLTTDGGLRTGRDIALAAAMGAEEFGYGLLSLIAEGCILMRSCQNNDCAVGVATTDKNLREKFAGTPEMVENMMMFIAEDVRENLAKLGYKSIDDILGRADLLEQVWGEHLGLDISDILPGKKNPLPQQKYGMDAPNKRIDPQRPNHLTLDETLIRDEKDTIFGKILGGNSYEWNGKIDNQERTVGGRLSFELRSTLVKQFGRAHRLGEDTVKLNFDGIAGQSFGAFLMEGMTIKANGANDGVGKSLSGGKIVLSARAKDSNLITHPDHNNILGNAALYGATSGELYAAGRAGNRFGIRLSGGTAVVDGVGSHGLNYMTGGTAVILGSVGDNFASGISGGEAFVFDEKDELESKTFSGSKHKIQRTVSKSDENRLKSIITKQFKETGDQKAKSILKDWDKAVKKFKYVDGARKVAANAPAPSIAA